MNILFWNDRRCSLRFPCPPDPTFPHSPRRYSFRAGVTSVTGVWRGNATLSGLILVEKERETVGAVMDEGALLTSPALSRPTPRLCCSAPLKSLPCWSWTDLP